MKNAPSKTALALIQKMRREIEETQPPIQTMIEDIKMMQFTIRSVHGDLSFLIKKDHAFVTALWKLGKIDQIISSEVQQLDTEEKKIFFNYMEHQKVSIVNHTPHHQTADFEVEIVKNKKITNKMIN